jgi:hypothetical protein
MDPTTVNIGGWFLAEIFIIEHLIAAFIGMTLWKNKRGDPSGAVLLCAILGSLGVIILAIAKPGITVRVCYIAQHRKHPDLAQPRIATTRSLFVRDSGQGKR